MAHLVNSLLLAPSSPLKNLTCLSVSFGRPRRNQDRDMNQPLFSNLQHTLALKKIILENIYSGFRDMETLHRSAPNLQCSDLKNIGVLWPGETRYATPQDLGCRKELPDIPTEEIGKVLELSVDFRFPIP
jgi:hypothetical protein